MKLKLFMLLSLLVPLFAASLDDVRDINVSGTVLDDEKNLKIKVESSNARVGSQQTHNASVANGSFNKPIKLFPGQNSIQVDSPSGVSTSTGVMNVRKQELKIELSWAHKNLDYDLWVYAETVEGTHEISHHERFSPIGELDQDWQYENDGNSTSTPIETIIFPAAPAGLYKVYVLYYSDNTGSEGSPQSSPTTVKINAGSNQSQTFFYTLTTPEGDLGDGEGEGTWSVCTVVMHGGHESGGYIVTDNRVDLQPQGAVLNRHDPKHVSYEITSLTGPGAQSEYVIGVNQSLQFNAKGTLNLGTSNELNNQDLIGVFNTGSLGTIDDLGVFTGISTGVERVTAGDESVKMTVVEVESITATDSGDSTNTVTDNNKNVESELKTIYVCKNSSGMVNIVAKANPNNLSTSELPSTWSISKVSGTLALNVIDELNASVSKSVTGDIVVQVKSDASSTDHFHIRIIVFGVGSITATDSENSKNDAIDNDPSIELTTRTIVVCKNSTGSVNIVAKSSPLLSSSELSNEWNISKVSGALQLDIADKLNASVSKNVAGEVTVRVKCHNADIEHFQVKIIVVEVEFVNKSFNNIEFSQIARWENSYDQSNKANNNFASLDNDRIYVQIYNSAGGAGPLIVNMESFDRGVDPETATPIDSITGLRLLKVSEGLYRSNAMILVTDKDVVDDNFNQTPDVDGTDDGVDDKTIHAVAEGKIRVKYSVSGAICKDIIKVCESPKVVKLNLISMKNNAGTDTYFSDDEIITEIERLNKAWRQACIRFVDKNGGEISAADIVKLSQPNNVNLDNSLLVGIVDSVSGRWLETQEEKDLMNGVKDADNKTIDIIFIKDMTITPALPFIPRAKAFSDSGTGPPQSLNSHERTIIINKNRSLFTCPHEIGHILLDDLSHFTGTPTERLRNLMRSGTSTINGIAESKRLTSNQVSNSRTKTNLPQNP